MKRLLLVPLLLCLVTTAHAQDRRTKNLATRVDAKFFVVSTGKVHTGSGTTTCKCGGYSDGSSIASLGNCNTANPTESPASSGLWPLPLTAGEMNFDYVEVACSNSVSAITDWGVTFDTLHGTVLTRSDGSLAAGTIKGDTQAARGTLQAATSANVGAGTAGTATLAAGEDFPDNNLAHGTALCVLTDTFTTGQAQCPCICGNVRTTDVVTFCPGEEFTAPTGVATYDLVSSPNCVGNVQKWKGTTVGTPDTAGYPKTTVMSGSGTGQLLLSNGLITSTNGGGGNGGNGIVVE